MKLYVKSGELERYVQTNSYLDAANIALSDSHGETLDEYVYVDERGFRTIKNKPEMCFLLVDLIKVIGND